jgi:hypothetical protein
MPKTPNLKTAKSSCLHDLNILGKKCLNVRESYFVSRILFLTSSSSFEIIYTQKFSSLNNHALWHNFWNNLLFYKLISNSTLAIE